MKSAMSSVEGTSQPVAPRAARHVAFYGKCEVIPDIECKQLRKLLNLYVAGVNAQAAASAKKDAELQSTSAWSSLLSVPRSELKLSSDPLPTSPTSAAGFRSKIPKFSLSSFDFSSGQAKPVLGLTSLPPNEEDGNHEDGDDSSSRGRKRAASSSDSVGLAIKIFRKSSQSLSPAPSTSLSLPPLSGNQDQSSPAPSYSSPDPSTPSPRSPKMRTVLPTLKGWRRDGKHSQNCTPSKSCLVRARSSSPPSISRSQIPQVEMSEQILPETPLADISNFPTSPSIFSRNPGEGPIVIGLDDQVMAPVNGDVVQQRKRKSSSSRARLSFSLDRFSREELSSFADAEQVEVRVDDQAQPDEEGDSETGEIEEVVMSVDDPAVKKELKNGRWPFELRLKANCGCKDCDPVISLGLRSDYEPKWSDAAKTKRLNDERDRMIRERQEALSSSGFAPLPTSSSLGTIQADEIDIKHGCAVQPPTSEEITRDISSTIETGPSTIREDNSLISAEASGYILLSDVEASSCQVSAPSTVLQQQALEPISEPFSVSDSSPIFELEQDLAAESPVLVGHEQEQEQAQSEQTSEEALVSERETESALVQREEIEHVAQSDSVLVLKTALPLESLTESRIEQESEPDQASSEQQLLPMANDDPDQKEKEKEEKQARQVGETTPLLLPEPAQEQEISLPPPESQSASEPNLKPYLREVTVLEQYVEPLPFLDEPQANTKGESTPPLTDRSMIVSVQAGEAVAMPLKPADDETSSPEEASLDDHEPCLHSEAGNEEVSVPSEPDAAEVTVLGTSSPSLLAPQPVEATIADADVNTRRLQPDMAITTPELQVTEAQEQHPFPSTPQAPGETPEMVTFAAFQGLNLQVPEYMDQSFEEAEPTRQRLNSMPLLEASTMLSPPPYIEREQPEETSYFDLAVSISPCPSPSYDVVPGTPRTPGDRSPRPQIKSRSSFLSASTVISVLGSLGGMSSSGGFAPSPSVNRMHQRHSYQADQDEGETDDEAENPRSHTPSSIAAEHSRSRWMRKLIPTRSSSK